LYFSSSGFSTFVNFSSFSADFPSSATDAAVALDSVVAAISYLSQSLRQKEGGRKSSEDGRGNWRIALAGGGGGCCCCCLMRWEEVKKKKLEA
jgi:hypothetical protein